MAENIVGVNKDEGTLEKISRQLGMEAKKVHTGTKGTGVTPKKVVKSSKTYTKKPRPKKTYTLQYDKKKKKNTSIVSSISKYFKGN